MIRKYKREMLKKELGTNDISEEFHRRYGSKPNITKQELKLAARLKARLRKLVHKRARKNKSKEE